MKIDKKKSLSIEDKEFIELLKIIMKDNFLNQTKMAEKLSISKQFFSQLINGERTITPLFKDKVNKVFPSYFNSKLDIVSIKDYSDVILPFCTSIESESNKYIYLDKSLFGNLSNALSFEDLKLITVDLDECKPIFNRLDRVIIDTSFETFYNNCIFAFTINDVCYIRRILIYPDKTKCISLDEKDTFVFSNKIRYRVKVLGKIVPTIRL